MSVLTVKFERPTLACAAAAATAARCSGVDKCEAAGSFSELAVIETARLIASTARDSTMSACGFVPSPSSQLERPTDRPAVSILLAGKSSESLVYGVGRVGQLGWPHWPAVLGVVHNSQLERATGLRRTAH